MCKESAKKHVNVICCDAEKLPIRENTLDVIISTEVIYHLNNPNAFIADSTRILKKDGKIYPNKLILKFALGVSLELY